MMYDNDLFIGGKDIVDCFAYYFSSVYENQVYSTLNTHQPSTNNNSIEVNLSSYTLSITDVLNKLENITNKTSPDPDMISSCFFINCKFVLAVPL